MASAKRKRSQLDFGVGVDAPSVGAQGVLVGVGPQHLGGWNVRLLGSLDRLVNLLLDRLQGMKQ